MEPARSGREQQRYDGDTRLVAGCLPVMPDGRVVLIGSVKRTDWILPKGGWESDETAAESAVREAYEEAGIKGKVTADLGLHEIVSSRGNKSRAAMFLLLVTEVLPDWPEKHRKRQLVSLEEAFALCVRPAVVSVLHAYESVMREEELPDPSPPATPTPPCVENPEKEKISALTPEGTC